MHGNHHQYPTNNQCNVVILKLELIRNKTQTTRLLNQA